MDFTDDDFGDLYVDVEVQASLAVSGRADSGKLPAESKCEMAINPRSEAEGTKLVLVTQESSRCIEGGGVTPSAASDEPEASDSDDDLKIVLNDGEAELLPVTCGSNSGNGGCNANSAPAAANGVGAPENSSAQYRKTGSSSVMPYDVIISGRMKMETSTNDASADRAAGMPQCGYGFSLPWYRTIFDGNIDLFKEKPWRNPGADITDFFNFEFNEQSWKEYCKSLRQLYVFCCQQVKAVEDDFEERTQVEPPSSSTDGGLRPLMPKGRAINVEDGVIERIPSVDLRRHRDLDPDVVIEIPVDDCVREQSALTSEEPGRLDMRLNEASGNEDLHLDYKRDFRSSVDSTEEHASEGFQEGNIRTSSGEKSSPKENRCSLEGIPCVKEVIDGEEKEACGNSNELDPYPIESESSLRDRIHFSPTPSLSYSIGKHEESEDSESESSRDSAADDWLDVRIPQQRTGLEESDRSEYKIREANSIRIAETNGRKRSRHRSSHQEPRKRHHGRPNSAVHRGTKPERLNDGSPISNSIFGKKRCASRKCSLSNSSKYQNRRPLFVSKRDDNDGKGFPASDRERHNDRLYASMDHSRHREGPHTFGFQSQEESRHYNFMECSSGYNNERALEKYTARLPFDYHRRKSHRSFKEEEEQCGRHHYERSYFHERRAILDNENIGDRNWYDSRREPFLEDKVPLTDRDSRWFSLLDSSDYRRGNCKLSEENDHRNGGDYDYKLHRHRYESELRREKYGMSLELAYREKHSFAEPRRREFKVCERAVEFSGGGGYAPNWHLDRFASEKADYEHRTAARLSSSLSFRESWSAKRARNDFWRDDIEECRVTGDYDSRNPISKARGRDGWMGKLSDSIDREDSLIIEDNWVYPDRGRYNLKNDIRDSMRDVMHRKLPLYTDEMLVCSRRTSTCDWISTKQRSSHEKGHINEIDDRRYKFKKMREEYDVSGFSRNEHEHAFPKCQDPSDLIGRKGEFGRRSFNGRRLEWNSQDEKKHTTSANVRDCGDSARTEPPERGTWRTLSSKGNEKSSGKFLVAEQLQDLDFKEEGEIFEEPSNAKKRASCTEDAKKVEIDEERILESLKKMEKRRARFKEPITPTKDSKTAVTIENQAEPRPETDEAKQLRPCRKRRWAAA